jgi:hypothetical protein
MNKCRITLFPFKYLIHRPGRSRSGFGRKTGDDDETRTAHNRSDWKKHSWKRSQDQSEPRGQSFGHCQGVTRRQQMSSTTKDAANGQKSGRPAGCVENCRSAASLFLDEIGHLVVLPCISTILSTTRPFQYSDGFQWGRYVDGRGRHGRRLQYLKSSGAACLCRLSRFGGMTSAKAEQLRQLQRQ